MLSFKLIFLYVSVLLPMTFRLTDDRTKRPMLMSTLALGSLGRPGVNNAP